MPWYRGRGIWANSDSSKFQVGSHKSGVASQGDGPKGSSPFLFSFETTKTFMKRLVVVKTPPS